MDCRAERAHHQPGDQPGEAGGGSGECDEERGGGAVGAEKQLSDSQWWQAGKLSCSSDSSVQ